MKGILSLRPVKVWVLSHVYEHIKICYLSYAILSMLEYHIEKQAYPSQMPLNFSVAVTGCS